MNTFLGTWQVDASKDVNMDKIEEGMSNEKRNALKNLVRTITDNGNGTYKIDVKTGSYAKSFVTKLAETQEIDEEDGDKRKVTMSLEGNKLVEKIELIGKGHVSTIQNTREGDFMVSNVSVGGITGKRYYKKV